MPFTVKSSFLTPIPITDGGTGAINAAAARANLGITIGNRDVDGTMNQIVVTNSDGSTGNPTIAISPNPVLPGEQAVTVPTGTTAERPPTPVGGEIRYNSDTDNIEYYAQSDWNLLPATPTPTPNPICSIALPVTAFNYYNRWLDASAEFWYQTGSLNGTIAAGTLNQDMGTIDLNMAAGVWRITVVCWPEANGGIIDFIFNGETNSVDTYVGSQVIPFTWETTIATEGSYGFQIINNGKNVGSGGYNMYFASQFITFTKVS